MGELAAPRRWSDLTPGWMTAALGIPGAVVSRADVGDVVDGTNARARVRLEYAAGNGPASVFVKREGRVFNRLALLALGAWDAEANLVTSGARLPLPHPRGYGGAVERRRLASVVVMEDITATGGTPVDPRQPLTVAQVHHGVTALAGLHAAYWAAELPAAIRPWRLAPVWAPVSLASLAFGLHRLARSSPGARKHLDARRLERQFRHWAATASTGPQTLLHGDPHPGNTYALSGNRIGFYDWQLIRRGHGIHDVGYLIGSGLDPTDRRGHERDLLDAYLSELVRLGVEAPPYLQAWDLYVQTPAFGLATWIHTLSGRSFQPEDVCMVTIGRLAASYVDHGGHRS